MAIVQHTSCLKPPQAKQKDTINITNKFPSTSYDFICEHKRESFDIVTHIQIRF